VKLGSVLGIGAAVAHLEKPATSVRLALQAFGLVCDEKETPGTRGRFGRPALGSHELSVDVNASSCFAGPPDESGLPHAART
jgi:hypothetical protein